MERKRFDKIRSSKLFYKGDLLIYFTLSALLILLFFALVIFPAAKSSSGFEVCRENTTILRYSGGKISVEEQFSSFVEIKEVEQGFEVVIYANLDKTHFNVLLFDTKTDTVKVIESNCSHSKDCTYIPAIKNSGTIYCAPHKLKIRPTTSDFTPPVAGGGV